MDKTSKKLNMFKKNVPRVSSSGRSIKTPKHVLSTSEEEIPSKKPKGNSIRKKLEELRKLAETIQTAKVNLSNSDNSSISTKELSKIKRFNLSTIGEKETLPLNNQSIQPLCSSAVLNPLPLPLPAKWNNNLISS